MNVSVLSVHLCALRTWSLSLSRTDDAISVSKPSYLLTPSVSPILPVCFADRLFYRDSPLITSLKIKTYNCMKSGWEKKNRKKMMDCKMIFCN